MNILMNWQILRQTRRDGRDVVRIGGQVFGSARFRSGDVINTSAIAGYRTEGDRVIVRTASGTEYLLGKPGSTEPFAKQRLVRHLDDLPGVAANGGKLPAAPQSEEYDGSATGLEPIPTDEESG